MSVVTVAIKSKIAHNSSNYRVEAKPMIGAKGYWATS